MVCRGPSAKKISEELGIDRKEANKIKSLMKRCKVKDALAEANRAMDMFGVESLYPDYDVEYVNTGDTYDKTLYFTGKSFQIGSWGDYVETHRGRR